MRVGLWAVRAPEELMPKRGKDLYAGIGWARLPPSDLLSRGGRFANKDTSTRGSP
jgi:hypothetical protein